jgi:hypothetical protein
MPCPRRIWCPACDTPIDFETWGFKDKWVEVKEPEPIIVQCSGCKRVYELEQAPGEDVVSFYVTPRMVQ